MSAVLKDNRISIEEYLAGELVSEIKLVGWGELANPNKNKYIPVNVGARSSPQPTENK